MLVLRTSNFQGATIRLIVPRHKHSVVFIDNNIYYYYFLNNNIYFYSANSTVQFQMRFTMLK